MTPALVPTLRAATPREAASLAALQATSFERPWTAGEIAGALNLPGGYAIAAGEIPADGFALSLAAADSAELLVLVVAEARRRAGLGSALVQAAADEAAMRGARAFFLEVAVDNPGAQALYARLGFEQVSVRRNYYRRAGGLRVDARVLRLTL